MIASILLLFIGSTDIARARQTGVRAWLLAAVVWAALGTLAATGLGVPLLAVCGCVALAIGWMLAMPASTAPLWPVAALGVLIAATTFVDGTAATASGFLVDAYDAVPLGSLQGVSLTAAVAVVGVAVFLTRSGNLVARAALGRAHGDAGGEASITPPAKGWLVRVGGRVLASVEQPRAIPSGHMLRGGRLIGPVERLLIVMLALSGAHAVIAALVAAKGIVRFPEISDDRGSGSKAEEFLVGSLASWSTSAAGVLYILAVR
ncbi:hypothetical protein [Marisediminicola senii]|uniref:hypothetical protein n=1 Tax=Marisediminicola senii TaxID=2711233 RepID=UPI0013EBAF81|nr:hypothetical protein [Marisediminicola senii]